MPVRSDLIFDYPDLFLSQAVKLVHQLVDLFISGVNLAL